MSLLAELLSSVFERRYRAGRIRNDNRPMSELADDLVGARGEISGRALAQQILDRYASYSDNHKLTFFRHMCDAMDLAPHVVQQALEGYAAQRGKASYQAFLDAAEPPRQELIRRLNRMPGATRELVRMRADLLRLGRQDDALMALDLDFRHLFASWFNRGFLVLRPINWESPANILEKIIAYEAVHAIDSWDALRRRLQPEDRRCYAFFHPAMPDEPLIFVEVALTHGVPGSIQQLLDSSTEALDIDLADTAVFYSISNCQAGLAGISFGQSLIKQVAADLSAALPSLKTFVTLSPIPGFVDWLEDQRIKHEALDDMETLRLAAYYLTYAKRYDGTPLDSVARFHLGNGAQVLTVQAQADTSPNGRAQSKGIMVNYLYDLSLVPFNHEKFAATREITASSEIRKLATEAEQLLRGEKVPRAG